MPRNVCSVVDSISAMPAPPTIFIAKRPILVIVVPHRPSMFLCPRAFIRVLVLAVDVARRGFFNRSGGHSQYAGLCLVRRSLDSMSAFEQYLPRRKILNLHSPSPTAHPLPLQNLRGPPFACTTTTTYYAAPQPAYSRKASYKRRI